MTFTTSQDIARAAAPTSSLMETPAHLQALIHKPDLKPFNWRKQVEQVERITKQVEREQQIQEQRRKIEEERKRREKIAKFEIDRMRNADFYNKAQLKIDLNSGKVEYRNEYLKHPMRTERLISIFCKAFNVSHDDLIAKSRKREIVKNRQLLMWFLHGNCEISYSALGRRIGNRDHSTVMSSVRKINNTPLLLELAQEIEVAMLFFEKEQFGG